jgi:hypothetical protein
MFTGSYIICITAEPAPGDSSLLEPNGLIQDVASDLWGDFMTSSR